MGGTSYSGRLKQEISLTDLREKLAGANLPDLSIEQIYIGETTSFASSGKSRFFNVRTTEKDAEKVQSEINRLLGTDLDTVDMRWAPLSPDHKRYSELKENGKRGYLLTFHKEDKSKANNEEIGYASLYRVRTMLQEEVNRLGKEDEANSKYISPRNFAVQKDMDAKEENERYDQMLVIVSNEVPQSDDPKNDLTTALLNDVAKEYSSKPQPDRLENFDKQLATNTQQRALLAIVLSWGAILLYLWFRFGNWTFGAAAVMCLVHDLFFTLGMIAACHYIHQYVGPLGFLNIQDFKIDLPAVAALLTLVGYSTNDTIVVFDRIREVRGKNPLLTPQTINDSVNQTLSRTVLASLATWLVVVVLYFFGGEGVHLFAFVMVVGVIVGTYSSIYIASPLLLIFGEGVVRKPQQTRERTPVRTEAQA
jgi:SecD/SecF fusion protein